MSQTGVVWLAIYSGGIILTFIRHPIYGLLTYLFEYFNHPAFYWWGQGLPDFRWSFTAALVTLFSVIMRWKQFKPINAPPFKWFLALVLVAFVVTYTVAVSFYDSHYRLVYWIKLAVLYFLIVKVVQSEREYRMLVWTILLGCFLFGWRAYTNPSLDAGRLEGMGGVDTSSANGLALLLLAPMPFLGVYAMTGKRWERVLSVAVAPFILNAFILCKSRGSFLGLLGMGVAFALPGFKILRLKAILAFLLGGLLLSQLVDARFITRMMGLQNANELAVEEGSASGRVKAWKGAWQLMKDYPLGAGGEGFEALGSIYDAENVAAHGGDQRDVHSTYFDMGTAWGFPGIFLWFAFLGSTFWRLRHLRRRISRGGTRYAIESTAVQSALSGILVACIFGSYAYNEVIYWLCGMGASLWHVSGSIDPRTAKPDQSSKRVTETIIRWRIKHQIRKAEKL